MVVTLGKKQRPDTLVGRLLDCHDRIRRFVDLAARLGAAETPPAEEVRAAAGDLRRYFHEALPRHVEDEEESLLPRLRGRDPALDQSLDRMAEEHQTHEPLLGELLAICETLIRSPDRESDRARLSQLAATLEQEFGAHLKEEEEIIFPAIERWLPPEEQARIVTEMAERRPRS